jgi:DNA-binding NarL/FixJ family response regulator
MLDKDPCIVARLDDLSSTGKENIIRVLHVDDDALFLDISRKILMEIDKRFEIDLAGCVDEAFKKIKQQKYDVIVSDYEMPRKNGLDFLKELREQKNRLPFILFTGKGREEVAIKALNLGADGYFNKQGSPETVYGELLHGIRMIKQRKEAESALYETQILMDSIINSTKDMIWSVSADDFCLLTFNKSLSDYFLKTQNLRLKRGMSLKEIMPSEQLVQKWIELNKRTLREGSLSLEYITSKDPRVLELTFNVLRKREKPFGIAVFAKDITERKRTEEALKLSEERFSHLSQKVCNP